MIEEDKVHAADAHMQRCAQNPDDFCFGVSCMAWRWDQKTEHVPFPKVGQHPSTVIKSDNNLGYCGWIK